MKKIIALVLLATTTSVWATTPNDRFIDNITNLSGGSTLSVPGVGSTFATDSNTLTLTNKSLDFSQNTATNIPTSALATGFTLGVSKGGTGDTTLTTNGMLYGNGTSAVGVTAAGSQYQSFQAGASGVPTVGAVQLNQSAAVSGTLPVSNGGIGQSTLTAHDVLVGNGTSGVTQISPSTSGFVLTSNGTGSDPTFQAAASTAPTINNTAAVPQSVTAGTGVVLSAPTYENVAFIKASGSGTTTVTATPSITACTAAGQKLTLISESSTNLVLLQNQADLAGSQLLLNGPWTSGMNSAAPYTLTLICDGAGTPNWVELSRSN